MNIFIKKIILLIFLTTCFMQSFSSLAKDRLGQFALRGAGLLTCDIFSFEKTQKSQLYFMTAAWVDGYISATNEHMDTTYDLMSFEKTDLLMEVLAEHCLQNPQHTLFAVISDLSQKLHTNRVIDKSIVKEITQGKRKTPLYEVTLVRIQEKLQSLGFYSGQINGVYSERMSQAIKLFQESIHFEATGFPDQVTLWRLLRE